MATIKVSNQFPAPVDEVFRYFTDLERAPLHVSAISKIEKLTSGPFGLGTRWRETREVMDVADMADMEVTAFEPDRSYTITHVKAGVRMDAVFTFEPSKDGTTVSIEFELGRGELPIGWLSDTVSWAIGSKVRRVLNEDLSDVKRSMNIGVP